MDNDSLARLCTCHKDLIDLIIEVDRLIPIRVLTGFRDKDEQDKAFSEGKTKVEYPNSKHNMAPSRAVDIAFVPVNFNNIKKFYFMAGVVLSLAYKMKIKVRWGGDWDSDLDFNDQKFFDLVHFELEG